MSPQLHNMLYGFHQHNFLQQMRDGGFRPMVFMQHGLMVALWMAAATLAGLVLWRCGIMKQWAGLPMVVWVVLLGLTTVLCKSKNALALLMLAGLVGLIVIYVRSMARWVLLAMLLIPVGYITARMTGLLSSDIVLELAGGLFPAERVQSLGARLQQEDLFTIKAMQRPWFGWGGWNRMFPTDDLGNQLTRGWTVSG
ncbi:MAG: hypothetical protein HC898_01090 [Phycisphaerales bacterium]|nr:hypothetical protein [Phycisphaerales bacterium]